MTQSEDSNRLPDLARLLGEPPLLPGESENRYAALRAEVERAIKPKDIFGQQRVQTLTDAMWEEMRYKRFAGKLIEAGKVNALAVLLTPYMNYFRERGIELARDYYSPDPNKSEPAAKKIAGLGVTLEMINAKAAGIEAPQLALFDRLIVNRQTSSRALIRDQERRERKAEKRQAKVARQRQPARGNDNALKKDAA
jgi:hypothetical protein